MSRTAPAPVLPRVNTLVRVSVPGLAHDLPSRVEDLRGGYVMVAAVSPGRHARVHEGEVVTLAWAAPPRGLLAVPCVLEQEQAAVPPLWVLRPAGTLRRLQRRRFARADVAARVGLSSASAVVAPTDGWAAAGVLADLSEGGARVLLDGAQELPAAPGEPLVLDLRIGGEPLVTLATVVTLDTVRTSRQQVRLEFDLTERDADRVRRAVMQRQVEARCGAEGS